MRNCDYRYCWLRDVTFTLDALMLVSYFSEAATWRDWLLQARAEKPSDPRDHVRAGGAPSA